MLHTITIWNLTYTSEHLTSAIQYHSKKMAEKDMERFISWGWECSLEEKSIEVALTPAIKKEYQKLIKDIRENDFGVIRGEYRGNCLYPKPMMTETQMSKGQATINCGDWNPEGSKARADKMMEIESFKAFLQKYEATAHIEFVDSKDAYQIRIQF